MIAGLIQYYIKGWDVCYAMNPNPDYAFSLVMSKPYHIKVTVLKLNYKNETVEPIGCFHIYSLNKRSGIMMIF